VEESKTVRNAMTKWAGIKWDCRPSDVPLLKETKLDQTTPNEFTCFETGRVEGREEKKRKSFETVKNKKENEETQPN